MIRQVPELADGGYWYVVPVVTDDFGEAPDYAGEYSAQYGTVGGVRYAVLRLLGQAVLPEALTSAQSVIDAAVAEGSLPESEKPRMRIRGQ